ncbi:MAG: hypothetical protein A2X70_05825 [Alphaproteobacteria bacterium GWC2_42_16]|nr:MAG: hypothetical protein A2X70_05825 [Alphaproteobacteria bacterium GWC2_42_16]OFW73587.1 MAG: hypothetical protein A2Z80_07125 [Alphaproteobacteria bacterium GWA2_41_27]OFW82436.1 MAG: hypothetical protein A3E50_04525 [Alphaproteobacteria bacterium RIFCSPHIGHO2_12_FULL_42_100]OFW86260.1 MAG: hypothetical protein A2W06_01455 [Alphaproteobacteria bacterium RBG_16_42_14]OFW91820.1 MAG: hypothetical protein A3C41_01495 [Alphaproteobacteria bacterium RIFCSPHIGHO2_02_FULL_42_30]OFW92033.1 MAG: 
MIVFFASFCMISVFTRLYINNVKIFDKGRACQGQRIKITIKKGVPLSGRDPFVTFKDDTRPQNLPTESFVG